MVEDLAEKQDDIDEVKKGPAKKIAQDADGNWTKAAQGFARGQGITTDDIYFEELKGTEYAYVHVQGVKSKRYLAWHERYHQGHDLPNQDALGFK